MAESEVTALLLERETLHGVRLGAARGAQRDSDVDRWPIRSSAAEVGEGADDSAALAAIGEALKLAQHALKMEGGAALALPTSMLMLRVISLPPADPAMLADMARLQMEKVAPCSGDDLVVGHEVLGSSEEGLRLFAAAIPRAKLDDLAAELRRAALRLTRIDAALLGWWRLLRDKSPPELQEGCCALLLVEGGCWDLLLCEAGELLYARGFGALVEAVDLGRELTLSLLQAEMELGPKQLASLLVVSEEPPEAPWLEALQDATSLVPQLLKRGELGAPALGVALRCDERDRLDLVPPQWRAQEIGQRRQRRFMAIFGAAALLWLLLLGALLLAPGLIKQSTARVAARIAVRETPFREASETRQRVRLIRSYMDRTRSMLESLRAVSSLMPDGMELSALTYRREEGVKLQGDAESSALVYNFKDALDGDGLFAGSKLNGPTLDGARRRHRFELDARFESSGGDK